jgi:hypothetical protein
MSGSAVAFMIVVCTFVWGGFLFLLSRAIRSEGQKYSSD